MRTDVQLKPDLDNLLDGLGAQTLARPVGLVSQVVGLTVQSRGPLASVGDMAWIEAEELGRRKPVPAEVVGFRDNFVLLMPIEHLTGIRPGVHVTPGGNLTVEAGYGLLGRVLDGLARPLDGLPPAADTVAVPMESAPPPPMTRQCLNQPFTTGIKTLDGLLTCAKGQRVGIFAGSGVGKSTLLGSIARHSCAKVNVIALIGERGREVRDFVENCLGPEGLAKSVVVAVTSDQSPMHRIKGAATAMAIAEYFRDQGEDVLLLMDSVTRYSMAQREIGLAVGEPPTTKGYPPSVFGMLARLLERSGVSAKGTITAFYTVLVEGDDLNDPIADSVRAILDGHIVLSRELAEEGLFPAIDVLGSISRLMTAVAAPEHRELAVKFRSLYSVYRKAENLINVGAYEAGSNPRIDEAVKRHDAMRAFLRQPHDEAVAWPDTLAQLRKVMA
jgi:FliI/YscN family ATPase